MSCVLWIECVQKCLHLWSTMGIECWDSGRGEIKLRYGLIWIKTRSDLLVCVLLSSLTLCCIGLLHKIPWNSLPKDCFQNFQSLEWSLCAFQLCIWVGIKLKNPNFVIIGSSLEQITKHWGILEFVCDNSNLFLWDCLLYSPLSLIPMFPQWSNVYVPFIYLINYIESICDILATLICCCIYSLVSHLIILCHACILSDNKPIIDVVLDYYRNWVLVRPQDFHVKQKFWNAYFIMRL